MKCVWDWSYGEGLPEGDLDDFIFAVSEEMGVSDR